MTYKELKELNKQIKAQSLISANADTDSGSAEQEKLKELKSKLQQAVESIPDLYIKNFIYCKMIKGQTWVRISATECRGKVTPDAIRMACTRYKW